MEFFFRKLTSISATFILIILSAIFIVLFFYAKPAIKEYGFHFLIDPRWGVNVKIPNSGNVKNNSNVPASLSNNKDTSTNISDSDNVDAALGLGGDDVDSEIDNGDENAHNYKTKEIYGGLIPIVGSVLSTFIAMIVAVPIAMGIAVFLSEIAIPILAKPVGVAIELLAAIPSIIYGMWGLFYFGPFVSHIFGGPSVNLLVAGLVLGVMIIPFMASLTRDSMNTTPDVLKESAYAIGATKFEVIKDVIFPYAKSGILGSIILALGRALGETMAVAFVIGGVFTFPSKITDPTVSIPVVLANSFAESSGMSLSALFYLALILLVMSFIIISIAKFYFLRNK